MTRVKSIYNELLSRYIVFIDAARVKNIYAVVYFLLTLVYLITCREITLTRLISSVVDLCTSVAHWFVFVNDNLFEKILGRVPEVTATVTRIPKVDLGSYVPFDLYALLNKLENLDSYFFDSYNFSIYNRWLYWNLYRILYYFSNLGLLPFLIVYIVKEIMLGENDRELGYKTAAVYKFEKTYSDLQTVLRKIYSFFENIFENKYLKILFVIVWLVSFNVLTVIFEFFAYFYYFMSSLDLFSFGSQFVKFVIDFIICFFAVSVPFWLVFAYFVFDYWRRQRGYAVLRKHEAKNCAFCKSTNICSLIVASMRKGKTAFMTDMKLCWVNIHKRQSRDILHKYDLMFPFFPWEAFEADLKQYKALGLLKHPAHVEQMIETKILFFEHEPHKSYLYDYDYETFGLKKNVGNRIVTIFQAMSEYAKAYYVYTNENLDHSNYPIRFDGHFTDSEYLPKWQGDFFETVPGENDSRYSHIIVQDIFRMGKKVDPDNKHDGALTVGYYSVMEFGKSEKNQTGLEGVDINADEANQKNDKYEYSLYMLGHAMVMIDNICFANFLADDQRPMSIPAKLRDCFSIITLVSKSDVQLALPCFWVEEWVYDHVYEPFKAFYEDYRDKRGDRTVPSMLLKLAVAAFSNYYAKIYNTFGYFEYDVALESGTSYGQGSPADTGPELHKYYIAFKKTFSDRYKTDGMSQFFNKRLLDCESPLDDVPCYSSLNMTIDQMEYQQDYFTIEMLKNIYGNVSADPAPAPPTRKKQSKKNSAAMSDLIYNNMRGRK